MKYRSFALAGTVVGLCGVCLNIAAMLFIIYGSNESSVSYRMICLPWSSDLACGFSSVFVVYSSAAWILTIVFIAFICNILSGQLAQLTYDFTETFGGVTNFEAKLLDTFRRNFNILRRSVELADDMLSPLIAFAYCTHIPGMIFLLYQVVSGGTGISYTLIASFWIMGSSVNLAIISYFAVTVHEKAHSLRRHVHDLQTETFDPEIAQIQMLFLARLDGPEIGMTALGCFVITKERVLAVISTLITYFTILLQFKGLCSDDVNAMATANVSTTTDIYTT
ncbi:uncharacterized protein LOC105442954 [Strongylocentrotus purpuratus]|uniref:Gustatory receptor n=1 Tax=Strongylocentrotus purpuratus TaxID=7668 RepID=A0A7M7N8T9_STRPU|nr:uncharacterized protein LOC105442954 [Strongylocentrotus purpuratus]